jgi:hypothetical protein
VMTCGRERKILISTELPLMRNFARMINKMWRSSQTYF